MLCALFARAYGFQTAFGSRRWPYVLNENRVSPFPLA
jgi:hypothetical protein